MQSITLQRVVAGCPICLRAAFVKQEWQVSLQGGERPHVGSRSRAIWENDTVRLEKWVGEGHRDDVVGDAAAQKLAQATRRTVCVECGIHYDAIDRQTIRQVIAACDAMVQEWITGQENGLPCNVGQANHNSTGEAK